MKWAVGVTAVPERKCEMLPRTIESLRRTGFDEIRLFMDGSRSYSEWEFLACTVSLRYPRIRAFGNWWLGLQELYIREPHADRYLMVQDDVVFSRGVREYLEAVQYPESGYCNLCTYPQNKSDVQGWYRAPSGDRYSWRGFGAQALLFDRTAIRALIGKEHPDFAFKPEDPKKGHQSIDGAVVGKLESFKIMEHVHNPSLASHIGTESTMGHRPQPEMHGFRGEMFDAMSLLGAR